MTVLVRLAFFLGTVVFVGACGVSSGNDRLLAPSLAEPESSATFTSTTVAVATSIVPSRMDAVRSFQQQMAENLGAHSMASIQCDPSLTMMPVGSFTSCRVGDSPALLVDVFLTRQLEFEWGVAAIVDAEPATSTTQSEPLPYLAPDPYAVLLLVKDHFDYYQLSGGIAEELEHLVDYYLELDRNAYGAWQAGEQWDVGARFTLYFESRYATEIAVARALEARPDVSDFPQMLSDSIHQCRTTPCP